MDSSLANNIITIRDSPQHVKENIEQSARDIDEVKHKSYENLGDIKYMLVN